MSVISALAWTDFKKRYAGSHLGAAWAFIQPVVTVAVFWFVFVFGVRAQPVQGVSFLVWLVCGLVPWFYFSEGLLSISNVLIEYSYLVKKIVFRIELLPFVKLLPALMIHLFFMILMLVVAVTSGVRPGWGLVQLFYYGIALTALVAAIGQLTVSVMPFFKDLGNVIGIFLQFGMWMTPIMWEQSKLPPDFHWIVFANPVTYIVDGYRDAVLSGSWFWEKPAQSLYFWLLVVILAVSGRILFKRLRPHFADVL